MENSDKLISSAHEVSLEDEIMSLVREILNTGQEFIGNLDCVC